MSTAPPRSQQDERGVRSEVYRMDRAPSGVRGGEGELARRSEGEAMDFEVLGPLHIEVDSRRIRVGSRTQRTLLAVLLCRANEVVSTDALCDALWPAGQPRQAHAALQVNVHRLRQALGDSARIVLRQPGYLLLVGREELDVTRFDDLVGRAREEWQANRADSASDLFRQALSLWRGSAFDGFDDVPLLRTEARRLNERRLAALEEHVDIDLSLGRHTDVIADLTAEVDAHPYRERLCEQLMTALYRAGRPAEALRHYDVVRRLLADELGTDPSPRLREVHQRVLTADPELAVVPAPTTPVPRQLPAPPCRFTGRTAQLAALTRALESDSRAPVAVVRGQGGVGKTWLALHWAHRNLDRFPDGQLHVDLRGFDPSAEPMSTAEALRVLLAALGVDSAALPKELDAQVGLYRSLLAGKRMLVVLDNARDAAQVVPLLPGSVAAALVTSRSQLTGLTTAQGARSLPLEVFAEDEARELLTAQLGRPRVAAEPEAVAELLDRCGGLPLALAIVSAQASTHPDFPLASLADDLREARLDTLGADDRNADVRAVFAVSHAALEPAVAEVFRLLGLAEGPDIGVFAAASLAGLDVPRTRALLRHLEAAHLVRQHQPGRYRMHDLVRLYAAERSSSDDSEEIRRMARLRLVDFYLHSAHAGERLLNPQRPPIEVGRPILGCTPRTLEDEASALAWFDVEYECLLAAHQSAARHGLHRHVWQLSWAMHSIQWRRGRLDDHIAVWRAAVEATEHLGDPVVHAKALRLLGRACGVTGLHDEALDCLRRAVVLAERAGDVGNQAAAHHALAATWAHLGDDRLALTEATKALDLFRTLDNPVWEAAALNATGWYHAKVGDHEEALAACRAALRAHREHGNPDGVATTLDSLGFIALAMGRHADALTSYGEALQQFRSLDNSYEEADTLHNLGEVHAVMGDLDGARQAWQEALDLYQSQNRFGPADTVRNALAALDERAARRV